MKINDQITQAGSVTGTPLIWLRIEGLCVFVLSILLYARSGASWWQFGLLLLVPDLSMTGYWLGARVGALAYNAAHTYAGPLLLAGVVWAGWHAAWLPYCLIWITHIAMDRALGYGLKYPDTFKSTHLGWLGARTTV